MRKSRSPGSVRGVPSNAHPYRDRNLDHSFEAAKGRRGLKAPLRRRPARYCRRSELSFIRPLDAGMHSARASLLVLYTGRSGAVLIRSPGTCDEDIDEAPGAGLPTGESSGVEDADEGPNEVIGV